MATTEIVRGAAVFIFVVFRDENGIVVMPTDSTGYIVYRSNGEKITEAIDLSPVTGGFEAIWDSSPADPGWMEWWARSQDVPVAAAQGYAIILANSANPQIPPPAVVMHWP